MNLFKSSLVALLLLLATLQSLAQGYLKADGKKIVNEKGEEIILRGVGLGGWMLQEGYMLQVGYLGPQHKIKNKIEELVGPEKTREFYNAWLANHTRKSDVDSMAAWGFNSIRLPFHYNLFTLPIEKEPIKGQNTWLEKGFAMTDSLLAWCKANRMYLILDLHAAPGGQGHDAAISDYDEGKPSLWESEANQRKTVALWRKLAERYANEPWIGAYDMINEPNWGFENVDDKNGCNEPKNEPLKKLMVEITQAIREVDKKHIVIVEGNCWGNNYNGVFPPWDKNMVVSFHKYWNYNDQASIQKMLDTREQYNVPIWLGESGENSNLWFTDAISLFEKHRIGWAWWPLKKLGFNNPLEVKVTTDYQKLLDYWSGKGPKPSEEVAYKALMELAENTKLENCRCHKDVVDAMFRQVQSNQAQPFQKHVIEPNAIIYAVDYDLGRNGIAYFDTDTANYHIATNGPRTPWNRGHTYRNDGVDIDNCSDAQSNGYHVGWIETGEWLQYTVNVKKAGVYDVQLRTSSDKDNGQLSLHCNGSPLAKALKITNTGGLGRWQTTVVKGVTLPKGVAVLRVKAEQGGMQLNRLQFVMASGSTQRKAKEPIGKAKNDLSKQ